MDNIDRYMKEVYDELDDCFASGRLTLARHPKLFEFHLRLREELGEEPRPCKTKTKKR